MYNGPDDLSQDAFDREMESLNESPDPPHELKECGHIGYMGIECVQCFDENQYSFNHATRTVTHKLKSVTFNQYEWNWINNEMKTGDMFKAMRFIDSRLMVDIDESDIEQARRLV